MSKNGDFLDFIQPVYDGGVFQEILSNKSSNKWLESITTSLSKAGYKSILILSLIWITSLLFYLLFFVTYAKLKFSRTTKSAGFTRRSSKIIKFNIFSQTKHQKRCIQLTFTCIMIFVVLCNCCISIGFFWRLNTALNNNENDHDSSDLKPSIGKTLANIKSFVISNINDGENTKIFLVNDLSNFINLQIDYLISYFVESLLKDLRILEILQDAHTTLHGVTTIMNITTLIKPNYDLLLSRIHECNGYLLSNKQMILENLHNLQDIMLYTKNANFESNFNYAINKTMKLMIYINQSNINFDNSNLINIVINQLKVNVSSFDDKLSEARFTIDKHVSVIKDTAKQQVNLDKMASMYIDPYFRKARNFINESLNPSFSTMRGQSGYWIGNISMIQLTCFLFIMIYFFVNIITLIFLLKQVIAAPRALSKTEYCPMTELSKVNGDSTFVEHNGNVPRSKKFKPVKCAYIYLQYQTLFSKTHSVKMRWSVFLAYSFVFSFFFILPTTLASVDFLLSRFIHTEVCRYFIHEKGIQKLDTLLYNFFKLPWKKLIWNITNFLNPYEIVINLNQPKLLVYPLKQTCSNHSIGLLQALDLKLVSIINITEIFKSQLVNGYISMGQTLLKKKIIEVDLQSIVKSNLPEDLDSILEQVKEVAKTLIDDVDYSKGIAELKKNHFLVGDMTTYLRSMNVLLDNLSNWSNTSSLPPDKQFSYESSILILRYIIKSLKPKEEIMREINYRKSHLLSWFEVLQSTRFIGKKIKSMQKQLRIFKGLLRSQYLLFGVVDKVYSTTVQQGLTRFQTKLIQVLHYLDDRLLKCGNLHIAYLGLTNGVCDKVNNSLNAFSLSLIVSVVMLQILYLIVCCSHSLTIEPRNLK